MHSSGWFESGKRSQAGLLTRRELCCSPLNAFGGVMVCMRIECSHDFVWI